MAMFVCPSCGRTVRIANGEIGKHFEPKPHKTWTKRDGEDRQIMIDIYAECKWSGAGVLFPNRAK